MIALVVYPAATDNSSSRNSVRFPHFTLLRRGICDDTQPVVLPDPFGFPRIDLHHDPRLVARLFQSHTCQANTNPTNPDANAPKSPNGIVNLMKKACQIGRMLDHFHDQSR
jgi:hypothetical protein